MKKNKKIRRLLTSFICLIGSTIGLITGLSSCVSSSNGDKNDDDQNDNTTTPPNLGDDNENNNNNNDNSIDKPDVKPEVKPPIDNKPTNPSLPENNNPLKPPNHEQVNSDSVSLKEYGKLLPSQYLLDISDLNNLNIDETKLIKSFDTSKIDEVKYVVLILNDWSGVLSIKMQYKSKIDNNFYEFIFNFTNLCSLKNQNYNLYFNVENNNLLNAKEISNKSINDHIETKIFLNYLKNNKTNLIFKNNMQELPIEYLNFDGGLSIQGFRSSWYTSNDNLELSIQPKLLKLNIYEKNENSNTINIRKIDYPSNLIGGNKKPIKLTCSSALDYLLEKIIVNDEHQENKFACYYYYDIVDNNCLKTQLKLKNDEWLKNVVHSIDGYNEKQYMPVISRSSNPSIDDQGNLNIQIQMRLSDEDVLSRKSKELVIRSFLPLNDDLFYYDDNNKDNKLNLFCDVNYRDEIYDYIIKKQNVEKIRNEIKNSHETVVDLSRYFNRANHIFFIKYIKLFFGSSELIYDNISNYYTSIDEKISIKNYYIVNYNSDDILIQYNKINKCFQIKCKLSIECNGINFESSTSDYMSINITNINKPFI